MAQALVQEPQCCGSSVVSMHIPAQFWTPRPPQGGAEGDGVGGVVVFVGEMEEKGREVVLKVGRAGVEVGNVEVVFRKDVEEKMSEVVLRVVEVEEISEVVSKVTVVEEMSEVVSKVGMGEVKVGRVDVVLTVIDVEDMLAVVLRVAEVIEEKPEVVFRNAELEAMSEVESVVHGVVLFAYGGVGGGGRDRKLVDSGSVAKEVLE